jgi:hypothetical protein
MNNFLGALIFPKATLAEVVRCYRDAGPAEKWAATELICDENIRFDDWLAGQKSIKTIDVERLVKCLP